MSADFRVQPCSDLNRFGKRLESWKQIAAYLDRHVTTDGVGRSRKAFPFIDTLTANSILSTRTRRNSTRGSRAVSRTNPARHRRTQRQALRLDPGFCRPHRR
jgi:hypothetical protein